MKSRVWRRYGWFSALAFVGSVGGLVTAAADIRYRYNFHRSAYWYKDTNGFCSFEKGLLDAIECFKLEAVNGALTSQWLAVSPVPYAIEFLCLCCAKLLVRAHSSLRSQSRRPHREQVVERMADFVGRQFLNRWTKLLPRAVIVSVTILNAMNVVFMAMFSYFAAQSLLRPTPHFSIALILFLFPFALICFRSGASFFSKIVDKLENYNLSEIVECAYIKDNCIMWQHLEYAVASISDGLKFAGYGSICEGCSLVIMLVSFLAAGVLCIRRFYSGAASSETEAGRQIKKVRRQIIVTVSTVFVAFLMRSVYAAALAASRRGRILSKNTGLVGSASTLFCKTGAGLCDPCQDLGVVVQTWLYLCPEFSFTVFLLSSPVTILVSLWGMTTDSLLQSLRSEKPRQMSLKSLRDINPIIQAVDYECSTFSP